MDNVKFIWEVTHWHNKFVSPTDELEIAIEHFESEFGETPTKVLVTNDAMEYLRKQSLKDVNLQYLEKYGLGKSCKSRNLLQNIKYLFFVVTGKLLGKSLLNSGLGLIYVLEFEIDDNIFYQYGNSDKIILCGNYKYLVLYI
jgi:hypothetical protein